MRCISWLNHKEYHPYPRHHIATAQSIHRWIGRNNRINEGLYVFLRHVVFGYPERLDDQPRIRDSLTVQFPIRQEQGIDIVFPNAITANAALVLESTPPDKAITVC